MYFFTTPDFPPLFSLYVLLFLSPLSSSPPFFLSHSASFPTSLFITIGQAATKHFPRDDAHTRRHTRPGRGAHPHLPLIFILTSLAHVLVPPSRPAYGNGTRAMRTSSTSAANRPQCTPSSPAHRTGIAPPHSLPHIRTGVRRPRTRARTLPTGRRQAGDEGHPHRAAPPRFLGEGSTRSSFALSSAIHGQPHSS